ncbi:MAG TPA: efflux RND transporter periplasmic adaptor subunit [Pyrinomonadaceae bacterium]|jgi:multidrug efflux pump subunit AcrA (membrane-fusion protein)
MSEESERTQSARAEGHAPAPDEVAGEVTAGGEPAAAAEELIVERQRVVLDEDRRQRARKQRTTLVAVAAVAVVAIVVVAALVWRARRSVETETEETAVVVSVRVAKAERQPIAAQQTALGTIFPRDTALVAPKISAQIKQMPLWQNRVVRAGDVLAVLEASDLQSQRNEAVAALREARASARGVETGTIPQNTAQDEKALRDARAAADNARRTYERRQALYQAGGISKKDLEASQLDLTRAESDLRLAEANVSLRTRALNPNDRAQAAARVAQAEQHVGALDAQLAYATVRAPISGVVTDQSLYEGSFASSGTTLVTIADTTLVIVKAPFADTVAAQLKVGDAATVLPTDLPGEQMTGQVTLISRAVDPASRTVEVWVTLGNEAGRLRVNGAAQVTVAANAKREAVVVPAAAVTLDASNADEGTVMVVDDKSVAHETKVTVGIRTKDFVEITAGLAGGETVVTEGNYALPDGAKVEVSAGDEEGAGDEQKDADEGGAKGTDERKGTDEGDKKTGAEGGKKAGGEK